MWKLYNPIFTCCNLDKKSSATFEAIKKNNCVIDNNNSSPKEYKSDAFFSYLIA